MREKWSKKSLRRLILVCAVWIVGVLCGMTVSAADTVELHYGGTLEYDVALNVYEMVNQERAKAGLGKVVQNADLQQAAMIRAMEIGLYYSHTRPDGTRGLDIVPNRVGVRAENIAVGAATASDVMTAWMNSAGHRANILHKEVKQIGVGCFYQNGVRYWVQLFNGSTLQSSFKTGRVNSAIKVNALPELLDIGFSVNGTLVREGAVVTVDENETIQVTAMQYNEAHWIALYGNSPALRWSAGSDSFTVTTSDERISVQVKGVKSGAKTALRLECGGRAWELPVQVTHTHKPDGYSCTQDVYCSTCHELLEKRLGTKNLMGMTVPIGMYAAAVMSGLKGIRISAGRRQLVRENSVVWSAANFLQGEEVASTRKRPARSRPLVSGVEIRRANLHPVSGVLGKQRQKLQRRAQNSRSALVMCVEKRKPGRWVLNFR